MRAVDLSDVSRWLFGALELVLVVSAPALVACVVVGVLIGLAQAATQIHDTALAFVPRVAAVGAALAFGGAWMGAELVTYTSTLWQHLPRLMQ